jgi:hypothetical protein
MLSNVLIELHASASVCTKVLGRGRKVDTISLVPQLRKWISEAISFCSAATADSKCRIVAHPLFYV